MHSKDTEQATYITSRLRSCFPFGNQSIMIQE